MVFWRAISRKNIFVRTELAQNPLLVPMMTLVIDAYIGAYIDSGRWYNIS